MRRAVIAVAMLTLALSGLGSVAYGYWRTVGTGAGSGRTTTLSALTITPGTPANRLYPGTSADLALTIGNANSSAVRVPRLTLDTAQGTGGFAVDGSHSACPVTALSYAAQNNGGNGWNVPANGSLVLSLANAVTLAAGAANACQGATFLVYLIPGTGA